MADIDDANDLWTFALRLYGAPGVSEACLQLQEESGVDVPLLLFAAWLEMRSVALSTEDIRRIDGLVAGWRSEVIHPLRSVRRRLKSGPHPAPSADTESLRNAIKAAELSSERIELALLEAEGRALSVTSTDVTLKGDDLTRVVQYFSKRPPDTAALASLDVVRLALASL